MNTEETNQSPTEFTIIRSKWFRGLGSFGSSLLRVDGTMCCLGQVARQCGVKNEEMRGTGSPEGLDNSVRPLLPAFLLAGDGRNSDVCRRMMEINDSLDLGDDEREQKLTEIAAANGITLHFVD